MNFYNYMIRNYKTSDSPAGDLARDMARDSEHFPRNRACKFKGWPIIIWSEAALVMPALRPLRNAGRNMSDARKRN